MAETVNVQGLPEEMCEGSSGQLAFAVNVFLAGYWANTSQDDGFTADLLYGSVAVARMKDYQRDSNVKSNGICDLPTRAVMKKDGFDFEVAASIRNGKTTFVRSDGSHLVWWPENKSTP
jgi:hypothetical protein